MSNQCYKKLIGITESKFCYNRKHLFGNKNKWSRAISKTDYVNHLSVLMIKKLQFFFQNISVLFTELSTQSWL